MPEDTKPDQSVLDQVINLDKKDRADTPVSAVAAVIKQRDELKKQIESKIAEDSSVQETPEGGDSGSDSADDSGGEDDDMDFGDMDDEGGEDDTDSQADGKDDSGDKGEDKDKEDEKEDDKADDKEKDDKGDKVTADDLDKAATESLTLIRRDAAQDYFQAVKLQHSGYLQHIKGLPNASKHARLSLEEHPVVYTKDKVLEALNAVVGTVAIYSKTIQQIFNTMSGSIKSYVETLSYYDEYAKADKVSFTSKLVEDKDSLINLSLGAQVDIKSSLRALYKYNSAVATLSKTALSNTVNTLPGTFQTSGFSKDDKLQEFTYSDKLPGFTTVKANAPIYENYLRTKVEEYAVYSLNVSKTQDYYSVPALGLDKPEDLKTILDYSLKLVTSLAVIADNMKGLDTALQATLDKVKVKIFDVQNNKVQDLASLGLDEVLHDVIKLKLVIEASLVTVKLNNKFLVSLLGFLKTTVALK